MPIRVALFTNLVDLHIFLLLILPIKIIIRVGHFSRVFVCFNEIFTFQSHHGIGVTEDCEF